MGQMPFENFIREYLVERTKPIGDAINKLTIFGHSASEPIEKCTQQEKSFKNDVDLFSHLYMRCQNWDGKRKVFFQLENQA